VNNEQLMHRYYPESNISGFSHVDGAVRFYNQINSVLRPTDRVLDFGAGRGESLIDDPVEYRRQLCNLQGRCAHLEGCDVDKAILDNPFLDHAEVVNPGDPLPYDDDEFDIVVARAVFEHIDDAQAVAAELLRVVRPGGLIAAITPNKFGYIAMAARMVPNSFHVRTLRKVQPFRKAEDIFPTRYRLNTPNAIRQAFGAGADVFVVRAAEEPAYHFGSPRFFAAMKSVHKYLPSILQPTLYVYIRKH
jgi:SAM-dependent methyltransferase